MRFKYNHAQYNIILGIAYWIADSAYLRERYALDEIQNELAQVDSTLSHLFKIADKEEIPFWVQNTVIMFAENWRRWKTTYLDVYLKSKNIIQGGK